MKNTVYVILCSTMLFSCGKSEQPVIKQVTIPVIKTDSSVINDKRRNYLLKKIERWHKEHSLKVD